MRWLGFLRAKAAPSWSIVVDLKQDAEPPPVPPPAPPGPPIPSPPDWVGAVKQLRDVAQWIIGGVVATAAGVFAGSTLTKLGSLAWPEDWKRMAFALGGAAVGFAAIAAILLRGLHVLAPEGNSLPLLAKAPKGSQLEKARDYLYAINEIDQSVYKLSELLDRSQTRAGIVYLPRLYASAPFCVVRVRFNTLLAWMAACVPAAILGFGVFAWAANPPDAKPAPEKSMTVKITL